MKNSVSLLIPLLICACIVSLVPSVQAQRSDTIYTQVTKNLATVPFTSPDVRNIGQSQHVIYVIGKNAPSHTCNPAVADIVIVASYDGTNYFPLSAGTVQGLVSSGGRTGILFASGLAPHIAVRVNGFDNTNCILDIFYAGSLYPVYIDKMENTLTAQGLRLGRFEGAVAGTTTLAPHATQDATDAIVVYGIICSASANTMIQFATASAETENFYVAANTALTMAPSGIPWLVVNPGTDWTIKLDGAANVSCFYQWRYE
jgi:hypothetical protein